MSFYGWNNRLSLGGYDPSVHTFIARIIQAHGNHFLAATSRGPLKVRSVFGEAKEEPLAVGDWIRWQPIEKDNEGIVVTERLPRYSLLSRASAGHDSRQQVIASNVDWLLLATSLNRDFNPSRLERYLTLAWQSGATPVVLLTKADLVDNPGEYVDAIAHLTTGIEVHLVSALHGIGLSAIKPYVAAGQTAAVLGSSGIGKSTLINELCGSQQMPTSHVREDDDRGRHTTTHRELIQLKTGGVIIDTPGMRELRPWADEDAVDQTFADIAELAQGCRFRDCQHGGEPGCAVEAAVKQGLLSKRRFSNYGKLQKEAAFLARQTDGLHKRENRLRERNLTKHINATQRLSRKRKGR